MKIGHCIRQPILRDEDLACVRHAWISHEHPDQLSTPTIKASPSERKAATVALFQTRIPRMTR
jgi:hypothetical protein